MMDSLIRASVDVRKNSLLPLCEGNPKLMKEAEAFLEKLEAFAETFSDQTAFEQAMMTSPLTTEYANIYAKAYQKNSAEPLGPTKQEYAKAAREFVADSVEMEFKSAVVQPLRHKAYVERDRAIRDIPVVGDIYDKGKKLSYFNFLRKKDKD